MSTPNPTATAASLQSTGAPEPAQPLISVIVRSMDRASLAQALDSVALQAWPAVEVVVVNAKGPAHRPLPERCGRFAVVAANTHAGAAPLARAAAANCGLVVAGGALALFLDDDDLLLPDHLARLAGALQAAPQAPAAFADVEMGREHGGSWQPLHAFEAGFDATRLWFENYLPIHAVLFRNTPATPRFDEAFDLFEDWDFWLQLASQGEFVHVPGVSARYRVTDIDQSNVFAESPQADAARAALFMKWQARIGPLAHVQLLRRLQTLYRETADHRAQRALAATTASNLKAIVSAREAEIAEARQLRAGLESIVAERDRELSDAHGHNAALQQIVDARTLDADSAAAHLAALTQTLSARERELADAQAHHTGLAAIIAAREHDIAQAAAHAAGLAAVVTAREAEIAACLTEVQAQRAALAQKQDELAQAQLALAQLHQTLAQTQHQFDQLSNERPLAALKRTLKKQHDPRPG